MVISEKSQDVEQIDPLDTFRASPGWWRLQIEKQLTILVKIAHIDIVTIFGPKLSAADVKSS